MKFFLLILIFFCVTFIVNKVNGDCKDNYPFELDVDIYWSGYDEKGNVKLEKSCTRPSVEVYEIHLSQFFDKNKESMIFVHGATPGSISINEYRYGFGDEWSVLIKLWLQKGYNVGFFIWTQFSDEPIINFERAEAKIWNTAYFAGMNYMKIDENNKKPVYVEGPTNKDVANILVDSIIDHNPIKPIRLVGHSLGTQLVMRAGHMLVFGKNTTANEIRKEIPIPISNVITRITLLDPVFSPTPQGYLINHRYGHYVYEVVGQYAKDLVSNKNVAIETFISSKINKCLKGLRETDTLLQTTAVAKLFFSQFGENDDIDCYATNLISNVKNITPELHDSITQVTNQHTSVVPFYMLSIAYPPLRCHYQKFNTVIKACVPDESLSLGAAMSADQVLNWCDRKDKYGNKLSFLQYDDRDRSQYGSTMSVSPKNSLFTIVSINELKL
jgi:hypothetical protein